MARYGRFRGSDDEIRRVLELAAHAQKRCAEAAELRDSAFRMALAQGATITELSDSVGLPAETIRAILGDTG